MAQAGGGYGATPFGGGPFGGGLEEQTATQANFDIFCFQGADMLTLLSEPSVTTFGQGGSFVANGATNDIEVCSGPIPGAPYDDARILISENVPQQFTVEWIVNFQSLPTDFTSLSAWHAYLGCYDASGPVVGLFASKIGWAYTGSVSFPGGNLALDCTFQQIPGSAAYSFENEFVVVRAAADLNLGLVYLYVTKLSEIGAGQILRAILPVIPASAAANPPVDSSIISVRGTATNQACAFFDSWCLASALIIPNLAPVSNAGKDQAVRTCAIAQLDGSQSFDPEGASLLYSWRLIEAPMGSEFAEEESDGMTYPLAVPTGFTDKFHSTEAGVIDSVDAFDTGVFGDVLLVRGIAYTIVATGIDGNGFFLQIATEILPDDMGPCEPFKVLRQRGLIAAGSPNGRDSVDPTFFPDIPGFYSFDLIVCDGGLLSDPSVTIVNVLASPLPRGCTPELSFIFNYLSNFWNLVEGRDRMAIFWGALAQVAATELFSLWQIDYSKSHRDIQRTFNRRWLHYDMLLGEPLPELTVTRPIFGGVESAFSTAGAFTVSGTFLVISSPALSSDVSVPALLPDPHTPETLAAYLETRLQDTADSRFTTQLVEDRTSGELSVRIDAPFPFTIGVGTDMSIFTVGDEGRPPNGIAGAGVGQRTYKVDRSLEGLGLQEDDFLVLDSKAFRIARTIDEPGDQFAFQRVVVKEEMPVAPSGTWIISGWVSSELLDFYNGLVTVNDHVDFESADATTENAPTFATDELLATTVLGANENLVGRLAVDFWPLGGAIADTSLNVYLARVIRRRYVPVHVDVLDVPTLQEKIVIEDDEASLRRNLDYFIEPVRNGFGLRFISGEGDDPGDVWEGARPPNRLWAEYTFFDNSAVIEANFGIPVELTIDQLEELPDTVDYLSAVRGLWYAFFNGPAVTNLRIGSQILLGLPFAERQGIIEEIRTDFGPSRGRMLIRDTANTEIVRSYRWPRELALEVNTVTGVRYAVGDQVEEFAPLVEGVEVLDYINTPTWFEGILNQGIFFEVEKFHKFLVRVDSSAFNLSALLFVRNFILKIKPTYTFPLFLVLKEIGDTEVSTTDEVEYHGTLKLFDSPCSPYGVASMYDQPRPGGGGWLNQFDANEDPDDAAPTFPTAEPVAWAYDKAYLCPLDAVISQCCVNIPAPTTIMFDNCFAFDTPIREKHEFEDIPPASPIPAGPAGLTLTLTLGGTVNFAGTIIQIRFIALGDPGVDATDYEVVIDVNAAPVHTEAFTMGNNTEFNVTGLALAVVATDVVTVRLRPATGGARSPNLTRIRAQVFNEAAAVWSFGDPIAAGIYCLETSV